MYKFIALCTLFTIAHGGAVPLISGFSHSQRIQSHGPAVPVVAAHAVAPVAVAHAVAPVVATHAVGPAIVSAGHAVVPAGAIVSTLGGVHAVSPIGYSIGYGYHAPIAVSNIGLVGGKIIG